MVGFKAITRNCGIVDVWWVDDRKVIFKETACCDEEIREGEEYAEINGRYYHKECLENMDIDEILALFDVPIEVAE